MAQMNLLASAEGRAFVAEVAREHGLSSGAATAAVRGLIPELVQGLERNTLSRGGLADLLAALGSGGHERYLGQATILGDAASMADGGKILGHLFRSPAAAQRATRFVEAETGVSRTILWQILPGVAALLVGWLARSAKAGMGDVLNRIPSAAQSTMKRPAVAGVGAEVAFPPTPDLEKIPGGSGPYGDLSDVLRRGGGGGAGSGDLAGTIRDLLGSLLGFKSKGVVGWLIRLIVVRYGWRILTWFVRRLLGGR